MAQVAPGAVGHRGKGECLKFRFCCRTALTNVGGAIRSTPETANGAGGAPRPPGEDGDSAPTVCTNCQTTITPLWRRDPEGQPLCTFLCIPAFACPADLSALLQAMHVACSM